MNIIIPQKLFYEKEFHSSICHFFHEVQLGKTPPKMAGEYQGRSYDMMFAHTTFVFIRYIMIVLEAKYFKDSKAFGGLYYQFCNELEDIKSSEALQLIIKFLMKSLNQVVVLSECEVNKLVDYFISSLLMFYINKLAILKCKS